MFKHLFCRFNPETDRFLLKLSEKSDTNYEISLPGKKAATIDKKHRYPVTQLM